MVRVNGTLFILFAVYHFLTDSELKQNLFDIFLKWGGGRISHVSNLESSLSVLIITETMSDIQRILL